MIKNFYRVSCKVPVMSDCNFQVVKTSYVETPLSNNIKRCVLLNFTEMCCQIVMKLEFSREIFEKFPYIQFDENSSV